MPRASARPAGAAIAVALARVEAAEQAAFGAGAPEPSTFEACDRVAWRPGMLPRLRELGLPDPLVTESPDPALRLDSSARSAFVRLSRYASADAVKLRAYVADGDRWLTLKVWGSAPEVAGRGARELRTREAVAGIDAYLAPPLLASGSGPECSYLVEEAIRGRHPTGRARREAALAIGRSLLAAYRASGIELRHLTEVVRPEFAAGAPGLLAEEALPWPQDRRAARARRALARLVAADRLLPCALGHGDLHVGNIVLDPSGRHWLLDWENGGVRPVAFDLRRLLRDSKDAGEVQRLLAHDLWAFDRMGRRVYRWREQVALAMANELVLTPVRRERARERGDIVEFDRVLAMSVDWLVDLLA